MELHRFLWVLAAVLGAASALIGIVGKLSRKMGAGTVDRFYYAGYGFMILSMLLFALRGFLAAR